MRTTDYGITIDDTSVNFDYKNTVETEDISSTTACVRPEFSDELWYPPAGWFRGNIQIPILRRSYPSIVAEELISVQPMSGPTEHMFNLQEKTKENRKLPDHLFNIEE